MMQRTPLIIVGAGGLGREVAAAVRAAVDAGADWSLIGFLDDASSLAGGTVGGLPVLGPVDALHGLDAMAVVAVASDRQPDRRRAVVERLGLDPRRFATIVHPQAAVSGCSALGAGTILLAHCALTADVTVGDHVVCMPHVALTHDDIVEDFATLAAGAGLAGAVRIEAGAYLGAGAQVRQGLTIGAGSRVGMGSVVTRDVPPGHTWAGVPARPLASASSASPAADDEPIPLVDLVAAHRDVAHVLLPRVLGVIDRAAFVGGREVGEFEAAYAAFSGIEHCVAVANGTDALEIALRATGIGPGDEVVVPANSFAATAEAVVRSGARPAFCDVTEDGLMDPESAAAAITSRTAAIIPVHLYGQMADVAAVGGIAARHGLAMIEDAAQSQGAARDGIAAGSAGVAGATSFYPGKNLGAYGDAGAILTRDEGMERAARCIANHGSTVRYVHLRPGFNSRLDTIQAAVLLTRLEVLDEGNRRRREAATRYEALLGGLADVVAPRTVPGNVHAWHLYVVQVPERDLVLERLNARGIGCAVHYPVPLHRQEAFAARVDAPVAERLSGRILSLPLYPQITTRQQERVVEALEAAMSE